MMGKSNPYIVITGPTATGKTKRAVELAEAIDGEIISADSRQVFRGMDIGSGKDIDEYKSIPYHLIDIRPAGYKYNLYEFLRDEKKARTDIINRGKTPILCGGTGLYVESVLRGTILPEVPENPELRQSLKGKSLEELGAILASMKTLHNVTDLDTAQRAIRAIEIQTFYIENPKIAEQIANPQPIKNTVVIGIDIDRDIRRERITKRLHQRMEDGMVDEVKNLINEGVPVESLINYGLEYKYLTLYITGHLSYDEMIKQLEIAIHQFAKRQMTWFRGMERRGIKINWLNHKLSTSQFNSHVIELIEQL